MITSISVKNWLPGAMPILRPITVFISYQSPVNERIDIYVRFTCLSSTILLKKLQVSRTASLTWDRLIFRIFKPEFPLFFPSISSIRARADNSTGRERFIHGYHKGPGMGVGIGHCPKPILIFLSISALFLSFTFACFPFNLLFFFFFSLF